jgi:hypothetical protein
VIETTKKLKKSLEDVCISRKMELILKSMSKLKDKNSVVFSEEKEYEDSDE